MVNSRYLVFFEGVVNKLDHWANDLKSGLEQSIKETDKGKIRVYYRIIASSPRPYLFYPFYLILLNIIRLGLLLFSTIIPKASAATKD